MVRAGRFECGEIVMLDCSFLKIANVARFILV